MEPTVISDSEESPPSVAIQPAAAAVFFLGIATSPDKPPSILAPACITLDELRRTSTKSPPRKSSENKAESSALFRSRVQFRKTSAGNIMP